MSNEICLHSPTRVALSCAAFAKPTYKLEYAGFAGCLIKRSFSIFDIYSAINVSNVCPPVQALIHRMWFTRDLVSSCWRDP